MISPGATIGILGGGQLGRMLAMAAAQLGYRCHVYAPEKDSVAAEVSAAFTCADWHDRTSLAAFAQQCAVVTYEFETVPVAPLAAIPAGLLAPGTRALEIAQDRLREMRAVGFRVDHHDRKIGDVDRMGAVGGEAGGTGAVEKDEGVAEIVEAHEVEFGGSLAGPRFRA